MTVEAFARYLRDKAASERLENFYDSTTGPLMLRNFIEFVAEG